MLLKTERNKTNTLIIPQVEMRVKCLCKWMQMGSRQILVAQTTHYSKVQIVRDDGTKGLSN